MIALTSGEPAGIGPDICIRLALETIDARLAVLGDPAMIAERARQLDINLELASIGRIGDTKRHRAGTMQILPVPLAVPVIPGKPDPANAGAVLAMLERAAHDCLAGEADAMVTAPIQKSTINAGGYAFSGHTEYLARLTHAGRVVMLLASDSMRVALVTTHLPLARVPAAITSESLSETIEIVEQDLKLRFGIPRPRILVLGLNPHAGEEGVLGSEEDETIRPVIGRLLRCGMSIRGPVAADTAFTEAAVSDCDVIVAMYHDQGLPALKAMCFGEIVNVSLGLPIIRTSVDHGTALPLAATGGARHASLRTAVDWAIRFAKRRT